jgi:uncharacterized protein YegL
MLERELKLKSSRVEALEKEVVKLREQLYGKPKAAERSTVAAPGSVGFGSTVSARPLREVRLHDFPRVQSSLRADCVASSSSRPERATGPSAPSELPAA